MYLAIDIGGTKTLLAVFSGSGKLLESLRFETPQDYPEFLEEIKNTFEKLTHRAGLKFCVAGAPGRIDRKTQSVIAFGNLPWEDVAIGAAIEEICGIPATLENDANLAGLSEAILIQHAYKKVLYVTISTGIGGIIIIDGVIEPEYADMEFGHMMFEHDGKLQHWQDFASGKAISKKYGKRASDIPAEDSGTWYAISRNIALGLTGVIANLTPEVIVIGGGVGTHFDKYADQLHEELMLFGSKLVSVPPLREAIRAEEAVIYGCYELALQQHKAKK
ncbi:MAG: ROK family protein [Candidatus Saccharimonadales bacterium]